MTLQFKVGDKQKEYPRLEKPGGQFSIGPTPMGSFTLAVFDDARANRIQIVRV